ncbi:MAG: YihY/virulence factor BrkB family protein [Candidatus Saccharimonadales bacterium]
MKKNAQRFQKKLMKKLKPLLDFSAAMDKKNVSVMAAGIAYFTLLAIFPGVAAGMAIALFMLEPSQVETVMNGLGAYLPEEITGMLSIVLSRQAGEGSNLVMAGVGIAIALFGASGAMQNTTKALNEVFSVKETRNIVRLRLISIALTMGVILLAATVAGLLLLLSHGQLTYWDVPGWLAVILSILRWPLMLVVINAAILGLFRYGANREKVARTITTPGATLATLAWLVVTAGFFWYLQHFAGFAQSYSIFAGIIALMMWFNLSATVILVGALFDARRKKA